MKLIGVIACILGGVLLLLGVTAETTAPYSDTLNIGLMQRQVLLVNSGLAALLGGVMLIGFSAVVEAIKPSPEPESVTPTVLSEDDAAFRRRFQIGGGVIAALVLGLVVFAATRERTPTYEGPSGEYNTLDSMNLMGTTMDMGPLGNMPMNVMEPSRSNEPAAGAGDVREPPTQSELESATLNALEADANAILDTAE